LVVSGKTNTHSQCRPTSALPRFSLATQQERKNALWQVFEAGLLLYGPNLERRAWHPINNTTCFILAKGSGADLTHFQQTTRAVFPHAGKNYAHPIRTEYFRSRFKKDIDRGTVPANEFRRGQLSRITAISTPDLQV
jgi:hypothetical protein